MELKDKLKLWVDITGVNPQEDNKVYKIFLDGRLSSYDIKKMNDRIQECLEYDDTGLFAETYLSVYLKKFLENKTVSIAELLENKELSTFINDVKTLYDAIKETDAQSLVLAEAKKAMEFYQLPYDKLDALSVVEIRQSAMNCINGKLNLRQFSYGPSGTEFKVSKDIYMFDSLDKLISCVARGQLNGISLAYIKDSKEVTESYFAFVIKNGGNMYILSDMPQYTHPVQKGMRRCPGRDMSSRIESNYFPYSSIAKLDVSDLWDRGRYGINAPEEELSTYVNEDMNYTLIGKIDHLNQDEAFWFVVMVSLIKEKFYDNEMPKLDISYTRSMISSPLLEKNENTLIVQEKLPHLELPEINIEDTEGLTYGGKKSKGFLYEYLVERYEGKVNNEFLNIIGGTEKASAIEDKYALRDTWGKKYGCEYHNLDLNTAGTQEEIVYRQKWIARYNYASSINRINKEEYSEKIDEIIRTIREYISPRIGELVIMHLQNKLMGQAVERNGFGTEYTDKQIPISKIHEFDKWYDSSECKGIYQYGFDGYNKADCKCAFTHAKAGVVLQINPKNADELALICGITKDKLPVELQHYEHKLNRYYGNPILDNIDPFLWVISDKFNEMSFNTTILLSKAQYLKFCTDAGVEPVKFWLLEKPNCFNKKGSSDKCQGAYIRRWKHNHYEHNLCVKCKKCKWYDSNNT